MATNKKERWQEDAYPKLTAMEKIQAISWAAKRAGSTYGQFSTNLTEKQSKAIFAEYSDVLRQRRQKEQKSLEEFRRRRRGNGVSPDWLTEDEIMTGEDQPSGADKEYAPEEEDDD